jgi:lipoprotein-anchoring transpeptidase ErfK/SrfK
MYKIVNIFALGCLWALGCALLGVAGPPAHAQGWPSWADRAFGESNYGPSRRWPGSVMPPEPDLEAAPPRRPAGGGIRDGGARPAIEPKAPPVVDFPHGFPANSIVINTGERKLYYVLAGNRAYQYPISVGREGFNWNGTETISRKQAWPDWYPPAEMRERDPSLPEKMTGGVRNPLGAMALYLGNTLYRIHGTNDVRSIGRAESSGCFRMLNSAVLHLASITETGTSVSVVSGWPAARQVSQAPEPAPRPAALPKAQAPAAPPAAGVAETAARGTGAAEPRTTRP